MATEDWSIQQIAKLAGTTSRALRHYDEIGLLAPTRVGSNGYRYYGASALARLQRILLLRDLGLGLPAIAALLDKPGTGGEGDDASALEAHLHWLQQERERLGRQIASVQTTITKMKGSEPLMAEEMFDGFDHTVYRDEVEERWGAQAYATSDEWWRSMSAEEKALWQQRQRALGSDWADAAARGVAADSAEAQALAQRQFEWLAGIPGTPGADAGGPTREYFVGLAEMYVADERFAANYGGSAGATFVRDAMLTYAERNL